MITPIDEVTSDPRTSCTKEEAVAKLLGWMRGSRRLSHIHLTSDGLIDTDKLPYLYRLPSSLFDLIDEERESASRLLISAVVAGNLEEQSRLERIVEYWDDVGERTGHYTLDIEAALSMNNPQLEVDEKETKATGVTHITLVSLDRWARLTYRKTVVGVTCDPPYDDQPPRPARPCLLGKQRTNTILKEIRRMGRDPEKLPAREKGKSGTKAEVREKLQRDRSLFPNRKAFDKAWQELRDSKRVMEVDPPQK